MFTVIYNKETKVVCNILPEGTTRKFDEEIEASAQVESYPTETKYYSHYEFIDGEVVQIELPSEDKEKIDVYDELNRLKQNLRETDYTVIKIAEGAATREEYEDIIAQRIQWRARINELEGEN